MLEQSNEHISGAFRLSSRSYLLEEQQLSEARRSERWTRAIAFFRLIFNSINSRLETSLLTLLIIN